MTKSQEPLSYKTITVEKRGQADWLTLNRPDAMNAISLQLAADLNAYFDRLYEELMLTARFIHADRALRVGLVSEVVPDDQLEATAQSYVDDMLLATPVGLRLTKEGINMALGSPSLEATIALENRNQLLAGRSNDAREAQKAFLEKRRPVYTNS